MAWLDRYMMVPFVHGGRDFSGCDCFGLYHLIVANEARLALPDFGARFDGDKRKVSRLLEAEMISGRWIKVAEGSGGVVKRVARRFDAVLMAAHVRGEGNSVHAAEMHVGCATGAGCVIHIESGFGTPVCLPLDDPDISFRVKSIWRPQVLAA